MSGGGETENVNKLTFFDTTHDELGAGHCLRALPVELVLCVREPAGGAVVRVDLVLLLRLAEFVTHAHEVEERGRLFRDAQYDRPLPGHRGVIVVESLELLVCEASSLGEVRDSMAEASVEVIWVGSVGAKRGNLPEELLSEVDGVGAADGVRRCLLRSGVGSGRGHRGVDRMNGGLDEIEQVFAQE